MEVTKNIQKYKWVDKTGLDDVQLCTYLSNLKSTKRNEREKIEKIRQNIIQKRVASNEELTQKYALYN